jgi:hypothetical protein
MPTSLVPEPVPDLPPNTMLANAAMLDAFCLSGGIMRIVERYVLDINIVAIATTRAVTAAKRAMVRLSLHVTRKSLSSRSSLARADIGSGMSITRDVSRVTVCRRLSISLPHSFLHHFGVHFPLGQ